MIAWITAYAVGALLIASWLRREEASVQIGVAVLWPVIIPLVLALTAANVFAIATNRNRP